MNTQVKPFYPSPAAAGLRNVICALTFALAGVGQVALGQEYEPPRTESGKPNLQGY